MRDLIFNAIKAYWEKEVFHNVSMRDFYIQIKKFLILFDNIYSVDENDVIAIYGTRSINWVALYLACFIKGIRFLIIPSNLDRDNVLYLINSCNVSYLFINPNTLDWAFNVHDKAKTPFLKGAYNMNVIAPIVLRSAYYNENLIYRALDEIDSTFITIKDVKDLQKKYKKFEKSSPDRKTNRFVKEAEVMNLTSGIDHYDPKITVSTSESICKLAEHGMFLPPFINSGKIFSNVEFSDSHIVTVLLPFLSGCTFTIGFANATVVIESTSSFEETYYKVVDSMFEKRFLRWLFSYNITDTLYKFVAKKKLQKHYKGKESVIIYNSMVNDRALNVAIHSLPLYTTYGTQEANQLIACNDFNKPSYKKPGAIGDFIGELKVSNKGELLFKSDTTFDHYHKDRASTYFIKSNKTIKTGDAAISYKDTFLIKGRMSGIYSENINLDGLERILKGFPFIKDCVLANWYDNERLYLVVEVNDKLTEANKLSLKDIEKYINRFIKVVNEVLGDFIIIKKAFISYQPLKKSFDGKVKTGLYRSNCVKED